MIIGHIPAGYALSRLLVPRFGRRGAAFLRAGVLGAVAPDLDVAYFFLVDHQQNNHHTYWSHFPVVWAGLLLLSLLWLGMARRDSPAPLALVFSLNGFVHMVLDSIVGGIRWLEPFADRSFLLIAVPQNYAIWWLNYVLHWTFAFELAVVVWAVCLWRLGANPVNADARQGA